MSWLGTLLIGLITAVAGCFGAFFIGERCVRWYRISGFEGGAGYFVMFIALAGTVIGLFLGIICSRVVASSEVATFSRQLLVALAVEGALWLLVLAACRLCADLPPTIDGKRVELEVEVRCPKGFVPVLDRDRPMWASVVLPHSGKMRSAYIETQFKTVEGHPQIDTTMPLFTRASRRMVRVFINAENDLVFPLPLRRKPTRNDFAWSDWIASAWDAGKPRPSAEQAFHYRYRVRFPPPPPPQPTYEEVQAAEAAKEQAVFDALDANTPLSTWLEHTRYGAREDRLKKAVAAMTSRPRFAEELSELMLDDDARLASDAMRVVQHLPAPTEALAIGVSRAGVDLASRVRQVNETPKEQDPSYEGAADVSVRFNGWMEAVRVLREKKLGDFTGELAEILKLARVRTDSYVMQVDVVRVASFYLHKWAGVAPLPSDPPPR